MSSWQSTQSIVAHLPGRAVHREPPARAVRPTFGPPRPRFLRRRGSSARAIASPLRGNVVPAAVLSLLCLSQPLAAAPVSLDCRYPQSADPEGGLRSAEVPLEFRFTIDREAGTARMRSGEFEADLELRFSRRHLTLFQTTANESLYVTTIVFDAFDESDLYRSTHSRHAIIGGLGELRASQYYGRCEPVLDEDGEPAA
jgi:hypothetical protein